MVVVVVVCGSSSAFALLPFASDYNVNVNVAAVNKMCTANNCYYLVFCRCFAFEQYYGPNLYKLTFS